MLARLVDHEEHEKFISSLKSKLLGKGRRSPVIVWCVSSCVEERQLRQRIRELTRYRKNGVTKEEGMIFACTHTHISIV